MPNSFLTYLVDLPFSPHRTSNMKCFYLTEYGSLPGYRLNTHKSQVLSFKYIPSQSIREAFKIKCDFEVMKYLGVNIPKNIDKMISVNYVTLISKIKSDQSRCLS